MPRGFAGCELNLEAIGYTLQKDLLDVYKTLRCAVCGVLQFLCGRLRRNKDTDIKHLLPLVKSAILQKRKIEHLPCTGEDFEVFLALESWIVREFIKILL